VPDVEFFSGVPARGEAMVVLDKLRRVGELAEPGVSYAYILRIEDGQRTPSAKALRKLADKLGTTALYLETGDASAPCPHCGSAKRAVRTRNRAQRRPEEIARLAPERRD
jgi:transcriptional regulator with XRE-family HTH domain